LTTALQCKNPYKPYTLAGFEPGIFCSVGGRDDQYATPPGNLNFQVYMPYTELKVTKTQSKFLSLPILLLRWKKNCRVIGSQ
jgi:hypothetical protein